MAMTLIKGGWIVAFQSSGDGIGHRILENGVVVVEGDTIRHVGRSWDGPVDQVIDASADLVIPGLINTHAHIGSQAGDRMVLDGGKRDLLKCGFLNHWPGKGIGGRNLFAFEDQDASNRYSLASLLRFGSTTVVEMGGEFGTDPMALVKLAEEIGIRLYTTPGFGSADHYFDQGGRLHQHWNEPAGEKALDRAIAFAEALLERNSDYARPILVPFEQMTSTDELLTRAAEAARRLGIGLTLHVAETLIEFHDCIRRHGTTPIGRLANLGVLGPGVILGHAMFTGGHSQTGWPWAGDVDAIAASGAAVAHCPAVFARRGFQLESFDRYRKAGIPMSIGTDSYPQDLVEEMKFAAISAKLADRDPEAGSAREVFNAATLGGAAALGRPDLGRIAAGAKADLAIVDLTRLRIGPFLDPIKALIHCGSGEMIRTVLVGGRVVVDGFRCLAVDEDALLHKVRASTGDAWSRHAEFAHTSVPVDETYPPSFARFDG